MNYAHMKYHYVFLLAIVFISCNSPDRLESALELAGDNRPELERVLKYYSVDRRDSLKYKAARFVIENMPGHYSYDGNEIQQYYAEVLLVLNANISTEEKFNLINPIYNKYIRDNNNYTQDIKIISADYLIWNIERAFKLWGNKLWLEHLSFDEFCEYILPYKVTELQNLDYWQDSLYLKYCFLTDNIPESQHDASIYLRATTVNEHIRDSFKEENTSFADGESRGRGYNLLNASTIDKIPFGLCEDYANMNVAILRSLGIPAIIESFPFWQYKGMGHIWYSVLHDNGNNIPAVGFENTPGDIFAPLAKYCKVYRHTYSHNLKVAEYFSNAKYIHPSINLFRKDVTSEYTATKSINVPLNDTDLKDKYAYLTSFTGRDWRVLDFTKIKNGKACFEQVAHKAVYMVMGYNGINLVPASRPFIIHKNGMLEYIEMDSDKKQELKLYRKFPKSIRTAKMENRILGGEIHASDKEDFSTFETIYTFNDLIFPDTIKLPVNRKYRYWRFYSKQNSLCNIAELQLYEQGKLNFADEKIIGESRMFNNDLKFS
ncbi:MAG TPA: hypothetical protein DIT04_11530 [Dysgonomonas sp.]|nr:hypothetical protein [Dysgonomonas sp.]